MATGTEGKSAIDKLIGSNWSTWKYQITLLLETQDLWGHVDGTATVPDGAGALIIFNKAKKKGRLGKCMATWGKKRPRIFL